MKKVFFFLFFFAAITAYGQKWSVNNFTVSQNGIATVYLVNEKGQNKTVNVRAIINPKYNERGRAISGAVDGRQGIMLTPPIRPANWEKDASGNIVPVGFQYNVGFSPYSGTVYIIEGSWSPDGTKLNYTGREEVCNYSTPNPAGWISQYTPETYELCNFCLPVGISKRLSDGLYTARL